MGNCCRKYQNTNDELEAKIAELKTEVATVTRKYEQVLRGLAEYDELKRKYEQLATRSRAPPWAAAFDHPKYSHAWSVILLIFTEDEARAVDAAAVKLRAALDKVTAELRKFLFDRANWVAEGRSDPSGRDVAGPHREWQIRADGEHGMQYATRRKPIAAALAAAQEISKALQEAVNAMVEKMYSMLPGENDALPTPAAGAGPAVQPVPKEFAGLTGKAAELKRSRLGAGTVARLERAAERLAGVEQVKDPVTGALSYAWAEGAAPVSHRGLSHFISALIKDVSGIKAAPIVRWDPDPGDWASATRRRQPKIEAGLQSRSRFRLH